MSSALYSQVALTEIYGPYSFGTDKTIRKNDSGVFFKTGSKDEYIGFYNAGYRYYKLFDTKYHILQEGEITTIHVDVLARNGKWKEYYKNGKLKTVGYYYENKPIGNWQTFYENGKLESNYNFGVLLNPSGNVFTAYSGQYEEYFKNGKLKLSGMYGIGIDTNHVDTTEVYDPVTNTTRLITEKVKGHASVKMGAWKYYSVEGIMIREENNW